MIRMSSRLSAASDAHEIIPNLWLGNLKAAANCEFLKSHSIFTVFNCTKTLPYAACVRRKYRVPVDDNLEPIEIENLEKWAAEIVYKVILELRRSHTVLIHCHAGMQRSAAVTAMVLISLYKISADDSMTYIRRIRSIAFFPAANFDASIRGFEKQLTTARSNQDPHK